MTTEIPTGASVGYYLRNLKAARSEVQKAEKADNYETILEAYNQAREYLKNARSVIPDDMKMEEYFTDEEEQELKRIEKRGNLLFAESLWKEIAQTPRPKHWPGTYRNISIGICLQVLKDAGKKTEKEIFEALKIKPKEYKRIIKLSRKEARQKKLA